MKIKLGKYIITIFAVSKLEKCNLDYDQNAAKQQAEQIKQSAQFAELKAKAAAIRAAR